MLIETFGAARLLVYGEARGWALAWSHAKVGDAWTVGGYSGGKTISIPRLADSQ